MSDGLISPLDISDVNAEYDVLGTNFQVLWALASFEDEHYIHDISGFEQPDFPAKRNEYYQCPTPETATNTATAYIRTPTHETAYAPTTPESSVCISPTDLQLASTTGSNTVTQQHVSRQSPPLDPFPLSSVSASSLVNIGLQLPTCSHAEVPPTSPESNDADVPATDDGAAAQDAQRFLKRKRRSNRLAVAKSRQKKSDEEGEMRERERSLCAENKSLKAHQRLLRDEVIELKTEILAHHGCCDASINAYIQSCAHVLSLPLPS
ncbi:hypothetical protein F5Y18DRAFT_314410 [Xylariaceae sp. FL1019]|nr:hypothetical protein F5Y18DRAFT_314410 [Xylariaceae sp. FL1019]